MYQTVHFLYKKILNKKDFFKLSYCVPSKSVKKYFTFNFNGRTFEAEKNNNHTSFIENNYDVNDLRALDQVYLERER